MILTETQVKKILFDAGFRGTALDYAVQIARCESSFDTTAHNDRGEDSRGLMQINVAANANPQYYNLDLFNPVINARIAFKLFTAAGNTFKDWSCARTLALVNPNQKDTLLIAVGVALVAAAVLYFV